jgi:hypothetical protein
VARRRLSVAAAGRHRFRFAVLSAQSVARYLGGGTVVQRCTLVMRSELSASATRCMWLANTQAKTSVELYARPTPL